MTRKQAKEKILSDFKLMKSFEQSAHDSYSRICSDPQIKNNEVKSALKKIAQDEQKHVEITQKIINIVTNTL